MSNVHIYRRSSRGSAKGVPARPKELPDACVVADAPARRCSEPGCGTRLRASNRTELCSVCEARYLALQLAGQDEAAKRGRGAWLCKRGCGRPVHAGLCALPRSRRSA